MSFSHPCESPRDVARYTTNGNVTVPADLWSDELQATCSLVDLTLEGCCVRIPIANLPNRTCPEMRAALIRVEDPALDVRIQAVGEVRWSRQATMQSWAMGIRFAKPLGQATLEQMVGAGKIDRRSSQRQQTLIPVNLRRQFGKPSVSKANIHDVSGSGLRLWTDLNLDADEQIVVSLPNDSAIMLKTVWCAEANDGYETGCVFANTISAKAVDRWIRVNGAK